LVTTDRFFGPQAPDRNRMYLKLHTLLRYYPPQPSFRAQPIFFNYASLISILIEIKNLPPDQLC
jgi:hypothetical protein